jgi:ankyrin repeat protein
LIAAAGHGLTDRVRGLLARGVDPEGRRICHPIYQGRSPAQQAALNGHMEIVALLVDAGASWEHDEVDELIATAMSGDRDAMQRLLAADPGLRERALERCPDQLVRAAEQNSYDAVTLLIELGFDVNARSRTAPLNEAAMRGNLPVIRLLLDHGADPNILDTGYHATPAGWAEHHGQHEAQQLLKPVEHAGPAAPSTATCAVSTPGGSRVRT